MKTIVVSAVNLIDGGGLTVLKQCLEYLSEFVKNNTNYSVCALVHSKQTCDFPNINYIEIPEAKKNWINRFYYEYWGFKRIAKELKPYMWLSLHDTTPNVRADIRCVYCHNPSPFYKLHLFDLRFSAKMMMFALFYKYLYRINIKKNDFVIVQQNWLKKEFCRSYNLKEEKVLIALPTYKFDNSITENAVVDVKCPIFFYPTIPRQYKNIETLCEAAKRLSSKYPKGFRVIITINGSEDSYTQWIVSQYKGIREIEFTGKISYNEVIKIYQTSSALVFPSRLETWGLPISEFLPFKRPMIIANLPYAHETAAGAEKVAFFEPRDAKSMADLMSCVLERNYSAFSKCPEVNLCPPYTRSWKEMFDFLLTSKI